MIAAAEAAADIGELSVDRGRLERVAGLAQQKRDRGRGLVGRLHPEHQLEAFAVRVVPGETAFRLEEHRVDGLGLEFPVEHQQGRIVPGEQRPDLLAVGRALGVGRPLLDRERLPDRTPGTFEFSGADPAFLDRRINIGSIGCRAGDAGEAIGTVVGHRYRSGFRAELQDILAAQLQLRPVESVEGFEDQQRYRLAEIERRLADRAEQIALVKLGNACPDTREILRSHDDRGLCGVAQECQVDPGKHMRGICRTDQHRV